MTEPATPANTPVPTQPGQLRGWLEVALVCALMPIGGILGALTGFAPMGAIGAVVPSLLAASYLLHREGNSWRGIVLQRVLPAGKVMAYCGMALAGGYAVVILSNIVLRLLGFSGPKVSGLSSILSGNLTMYLWFLIPVAWGSAAIGEELISRGFLLHRIETLVGTAPANVLQATIFALAHSYQGISGVISIFFLALVFGAVFMRSGRNLLPIILAHGIIDTIGLTVVYLGYADQIS